MSSYRDDREALRARVDALESELHDVKSTAAAQRADYERQVGRVAPPARTGHAGWLLGGMALLVLLFAAAISYRTVRAPAAVAPPRFVPAAPRETPPPVPVVAPPPAPTQHPATVSRASGIDLPRGSQCIVSIDAAGSIQKVRCGARQLYVRNLTVDPQMNVFGSDDQLLFRDASAEGDTVTLTHGTPARKVVLALVIPK